MTRGFRLATLALFVSGLLVSGALAEGVVRLYAHLGGAAGSAIALADPMAVKVVPHGAFGYRQRPGAMFSYVITGTVAHANALGYRGPEVETPKPAGTLRIVLLGESTTHGWGVGDSETIDTYMRRDLTRRLPRWRIEVVNLAFDGYDAYQIRQRLLSDGLPLQPDLVIVNTGVNDVRNAGFAHLNGDPDQRTLIWEDEMRRQRLEQGGPSAWTLTKHWFYAARAIGVIRMRRRADATRAGIAEIRAYPEAADNFQHNVARIADTLAALHIPLLLSTPPSALTMRGLTATMRRRSYWLKDPESTQRYRDTLAARLRAITQRGIVNGSPIRYVEHTIPPDGFLDDCHLTPNGNRIEAADFAAAVVPFVDRRP